MHFEFTGWEISSEEIEICRHPDGGVWVLGEGRYGKVFKGLKGGVQVGGSTLVQDASRWHEAADSRAAAGCAGRRVRSAGISQCAACLRGVPAWRALFSHGVWILRGVSGMLQVVAVKMLNNVDEQFKRMFIKARQCNAEALWKLPKLPCPST